MRSPRTKRAEAGKNITQPPKGEPKCAKIKAKTKEENG